MNRKSKTNRRLMRMADHQQDRERALRIESPDTRSARKGQIEFITPPSIHAMLNEIAKDQALVADLLGISVVTYDPDSGMQAQHINPQEFFSPPDITQYNEGTITPRGIDTPSRDTA